MADIYTELEERDAAAARKGKPWRFRADFVHDPSLPSGAWAVDGEIQEAELTEESLKAAAPLREGRKPRVAVAAPLHLTINKICGFTPPYA